MDTQFSKLSDKVDHLATEIGELKQAVSSLETRQLQLEKNQQGLALSVECYATEFRSHFKKIEDELVQHWDAFKIYSLDVNSVKVGVEYLSSKTGVHDMKLNDLEKRIKV